MRWGSGGLYDCTNIIDNPLVSIITSIGKDHVNILGNTLEEIAHQKAGIIKSKSHTILFSQSDKIDNVFIEKCQEMNNFLHLLKEENIKNYRYDSNYQYFDYMDLKDIAIVLKGKKQVNNAILCIETIKILKQIGYEISENSIREGLKTVIHRGRMEILYSNPKIIFDGAHNEPAIRNLQTTIKMYFDKTKRIYIVSILKRKDYESMIKVLLEDKEADFIFTNGKDSKYAEGKELYQIAYENKKNQNLKIMELEDAINYTISSDYDTAFVVGSFYVYEDVLRYINNNERRKNKNEFIF